MDNCLSLYWDILSTVLPAKQPWVWRSSRVILNKHFAHTNTFIAQITYTNMEKDSCAFHLILPHRVVELGSKKRNGCANRTMISPFTVHCKTSKVHFRNQFCLGARRCVNCMWIKNLLARITPTSAVPCCELGCAWILIEIRVSMCLRAVKLHS